MPLALLFLLLIGQASAQEALEPAQLTSGGATIEINFAPGKFDVGREAILGWVTNAANAVTAYFGHFPVEHPRLVVRLAEGRAGVSHGTTFGGRRGAFTRISVGQATTQAQLDDDWMMTHEFIHMAFPDVSADSDEHHWMEEGMATYIEPIARAQIGRMTPERVWGDFVRDIPQGLPRAGDQGLDRTATWGRTYWGGALFWLLADVQIREASHNRKGLQDAMRGILEAGGNITEDWTVERVVEIGDKATGTSVLANLYQQMKATAVHTDLDDLWRRLGVQVKNGIATLDDHAPLAEIRKAITVRADSATRASQAPIH
ncbi:MAG TPA: hypothetical protein VK724_14830 [Bryobacteraceae bacterium]|jgi:hypothetical protein|nr:hypothetical protein [Bryobacteraceae bacterium]